MANDDNLEVAMNKKADKTEVQSLQAAVGSPLTAITASAMIDTNKIYVYTGSETGYTNGDWYYWNGTTWIDGGIYNAVAMATDTTLTQPGQAADAKVTGDEIADLKQDLDDVINITMPDDLEWIEGLVGLAQKSNGVFNSVARMRMMCDIEWMPLDSVPMQYRNSEGTLVYSSFDADKKVKGIPYGAQLTYEQWIGKNISFETFLSALKNPNSVIYDFSRVGTAYRQSAWYSVNCSKAVGWALNLANVYATGQFSTDPNISKIKNAGAYTVNDIRIGDILENPSTHTAIITDLVYNTFGDLTQIEVSEAVTPSCRRKKWNTFGYYDNFFEHFSRYNLLRYDLIDSVPPIDMETMNPYISTSLGVDYGNKSNYKTADTIKITLLNKVSNTITVKKDGVAITPIDVTSYDTDTIYTYAHDGAGWYEIGFDGDDSKNNVVFCVNDNVATFDSSTNTLTFSSSISTLNTISFCASGSRSHISDVFPTSEDLANGYKVLTVPSNAAYIHALFANDYGKTLVELSLA